MFRKVIFILIFITLPFSACLFAISMSNIKPIIVDRVPEMNLPAIEIIGNYISPSDGINISEARKLIISKLKKDGIKGKIDSAIKVDEITTKEAWENTGVQLYRVDVDYAWLNGLAIIKNKKVLAVLSGMPTEAVFLADLDKDGVYEVYTNAFFGSGIISEEIQGYNVTLNEFYKLSMRMKQDIHLYIENGILMAKVRPYRYKDDKNNIRIGKVILKENDNKKELSIE